MLCHEKPNYIPDLLLHGLRKLLGEAVVDYPRKNALYDGCLGQPYLEKIPNLMAPDDIIDRSDIAAKVKAEFSISFSAMFARSAQTGRCYRITEAPWR